MYCYKFTSSVRGAKPIFTDIDPNTLNINVDDIEHRITKKQKAIVSVDYGDTIKLRKN